MPVPRQTGGVNLVLPYSVHARMLACARDAAPLEACGLLLGNGSRIEEARPADNVAADPFRHFEIDPAALIAAHRAARARGPEIIGYFHSHPNGLARPSSTDGASAAKDGKVWVIVAPVAGGIIDVSWAITCWHDGQNGFEPLSYTLEAG